MKISKLNKDQKASVESTNNQVLVIAPPGSGKTFTLIEAIKHYIDTNPDATKVAAITFTNAATREMKARIDKKYANKVEFSTIHSWAKHLLEIYSLRYKFRINVLNKNATIHILNRISNDLPKTSIKSEIYLYFRQNKKKLATASFWIRKEFTLLDEKYQNYKKENNLYDFGDYPEYLLSKVEEYDIKLDYYDGIFVDEYQDVDVHQHILFKESISDKKFFIGDPDQAIYMFRGASEDFIYELKDVYDTYKLKINFRSKSEIVDYYTEARNIFKNIEEKSAFTLSEISTTNNVSDVVAERGKGGTVSYLKNFIDIEYAMPIINNLKEKPTILCRTNRQIENLQNTGHFDGFEFSTIHSAKGLEYDTVIVADFDIDEKEDFNVLYVALSRAKNNLFIADCSLLEVASEMFKDVKQKQEILF